MNESPSGLASKSKTKAGTVERWGLRLPASTESYAPESYVLTQPPMTDERRNFRQPLCRGTAGTAGTAGCKQYTIKSSCRVMCLSVWYIVPFSVLYQRFGLYAQCLCSC